MPIPKLCCFGSPTVDDEPRAKPRGLPAEGNLGGMNVQEDDGTNVISLQDWPRESQRASALRDMQFNVAVREKNVHSTSPLVSQIAGYSMYAPDIAPKLEAMVESEMSRSEIMKMKLAGGKIVGHMAIGEAFKFSQEHLYWRKCAYIQKLSQVIEEEGFCQILLIADGINPMPVDLARRYPQTMFYCVDTNERALEKKAALCKELHLGNVVMAPLNACSGSFYTTLRDQYGFNDTRPCYATAEGLTYYITDEQEKQMVESFIKLHPTNRIMMDFLNRYAQEPYMPFTRSTKISFDRVKKTMNIDNIRDSSPQELIATYTSNELKSQILSRKIDSHEFGGDPKFNENTFMHVHFPFELLEVRGVRKEGE